MSRSTLVRRSLVLALTLAAAAASAPAAHAQGGGDGFLFRRPSGALTLRGGLDYALGNSDVFAFARERLTLGRGDFAGVQVGGDLAIGLSNRVDLVLGVSHARSSARSEFRRFVDNDDLPIEQTTGLARTPIAASLKAYITPRGREVGRFAWIPARVAPYVGAGGGTMWYRFTQEGDFVDEETLDVFGARLRSSGWTPTAHGLAGLDVSLSPRLALTTEARYNWARADMSADFRNFDQIDLSGLVASAGLTIRF